MNTTIVLLALNKKEYYKLAFNAAVSIKHFNPGVRILFLNDGKFSLPPQKSWIFDASIQISADDYTHDRAFAPGKAKLNIYKYFEGGNYIYLDVDVVCIAPFTDVIEAYEDKGGYYHVLQSSHLWASEEDIKRYNGLGKSTEIHGMNTSLMFMRTGSELTAFFERAKEAMFNGVPMSNLTMPWGRAYPDELAMTVACAALNVKPYFDCAALNVTPCPDSSDPVRFLGEKSNYDTEVNGARMVSLFGPKGMVSLKTIQRLDKVLRGCCASFSMVHEYKIPVLMKGKYANKAPLQEGGRIRG